MEMERTRSHRPSDLRPPIVLRRPETRSPLCRIGKLGHARTGQEKDRTLADGKSCTPSENSMNAGSWNS